MLRVVIFMLLVLASTVLTAQVTDGEGTWSSPDGTEYVGGFKDGKFHGNGTLIKSDGTKYVGEFQAGKYHGRGTLDLPSSNNPFQQAVKYEGDFRDGKYNGQGKLKLRNGSYVGEFLDGEYNGEGRLFAARTDTSTGKLSFVQMSGEWRNGSLNGKGLRIIGFGSIDDQGKFVMDRHDYNQHDGFFLNGKEHGQGVFAAVGPSGKATYKYEGSWENGSYHGQGTLIVVGPPTTKYEGNFERGKMHGKGTLIMDGRQYHSGWFCNDQSSKGPCPD